jgi:hypothetical protein
MRRTPIFLMATLLVVAACSSSKDDASTVATSTTTTSTSTTAPGATSSTSPSTSTTAKPASSTGCSSPKATPPEGATVGTIPDVDGDGRPDHEWIQLPIGASVEFGIETAAGGGGSAAKDFASGAPRSMFVTAPADAGGAYLIGGDGRVDYLYVFTGCHLEPVMDRKGAPYGFDLGFVGNGTGVGCATVDGKPALLGLNSVSTEGNVTHWTRTVIDVEGTVAHNGVRQSGTFTEPQDHHAIELLHTISCGDRTISDDGLTAE